MENSDIIYQDKNVAILDPRVKRGILVFHRGAPRDDLCKTPLKSAQSLHRERAEFEGAWHSDIFFRAPFYNNPIDYHSVGSEIISLYGDLELANSVWIRVDPDLTYVYSSQIRSEYYDERINLLNLSRKSLSKYLEIIKQNEQIEADARKEHQPVMYNLIDSRAHISPYRFNQSTVNREYIIYRDTSHIQLIGHEVPDYSKIWLPYPYSREPIYRNSEILVSLPEIPIDYFVACFGGVI